MDRRALIAPKAAEPLLVDLREEMMPGERLVWSARPNPMRFSIMSFGIWLFAIPWTCFSIFWVAMAWHGVSQGGNAGVLRYAFPLFGVPFVLVGLGMLAAPFRVGQAATRTIFGVTSRRAIKLTRLSGLKVESIDAREIGSIQRREARDGIGSITIETRSARDRDHSGTAAIFTITAVPDIRNVERLVRELADGGRHAA